MLTSETRDQLETALRAYMMRLDHTALSRIASAERWGAGYFYDGTRDCCCLVGHGEGLERHRQRFNQLQATPGWVLASEAFERLVDEDGLERVVAACRLYASCLLHDREEAVVAALLQPAFCPLAAREENHV